ncbi:MAG: hypothetical protein FJ405_02460 [Verrucomicrobia bacterium]|nr:hypothetical protein [Verrucomicrobiota bacterium]
MKLLNQILNGKGAKAVAVVAALCGTAASALADQNIMRRWAPSAPVIDGVVSPGEWAYAQSTPLARGRLMTMNNAQYLYVLLDVTADTVNNPPAHAGPNTGDWFRLAFDVDLNHAVTPNVDLDYSSCNDGREFVKSIRLSPFSWTGCTTVDPDTKGKVGFGPTLNSATPHRFWEMRIDLTEIGQHPALWSWLPLSNPRVRFNVTTRSETPAFDVSQPQNAISPDLSNLFQLFLATTPTYPGGSGPLFMGVGLVPATFIGTDGLANIQQPGYYSASNAPFGGDLRVFGRWSTLRYSLGASKYRVLISRDGGPYTRLRHSWVNMKWTGLTWTAQTVGPDSNDAYDVPTASELWYNPNQILGWQTGNSSQGNYPDGTYRMRLELLNAAGLVLPSPAGNLLTLKIVNTRPVVSLDNIQYNGNDICECGIVTQGSAPRGFSFEITVNDPSGSLNAFSLAGTYGHGGSTGTIYSDSYANGGSNLGAPFFVNHINADGPKRWNGVTSLTVPLGGQQWRASKSCAYSFILSASSRVQNGYSLLFPNVQDYNNLTILLGSGEGNTECPDDGRIIKVIDPLIPILPIDPIDPVITPKLQIPGTTIIGK